MRNTGHATSIPRHRSYGLRSTVDGHWSSSPSAILGKMVATMFRMEVLAATSPSLCYELVKNNQPLRFAFLRAPSNQYRGPDLEKIETCKRPGALVKRRRRRGHTRVPPVAVPAIAATIISVPVPLPFFVAVVVAIPVPVRTISVTVSPA